MDFERDADNWLHGVAEESMFRKLTAGTSSADDVQDKALAQAIVSRDIAALKALQIQRAVLWYQQHMGTQNIASVPHFDCYQSMLSTLVETRDCSGLLVLIASLRAAGIAFAQFDTHLIKLRNSFRGHRANLDNTAQLRALIDLIGDEVGPSYMVELFGQLGNCCRQSTCKDMTDSTALLWSFTEHLWRDKWRDFCPLLQSVAVACSGPTLFWEMKASGTYDAACNVRASVLLSAVRNANICEILLHEHPRNPEDARAALIRNAESPFGGAVGRVLLRTSLVGVHALLSASTICPRLLVEALRLQPDFASVIFSSQHMQKVLRPFPARKVFLLARLLMCHGVVIDEATVASMIAGVRAAQSLSPQEYIPNEQLLCALLCFQVVCPKRHPAILEIAENVHNDKRLCCFMWRQHSHRFCDTRVQRNVLATLLLLNRVCPRMPSDVRNLMLVKVTAARWYEDEMNRLL